MNVDCLVIESFSNTSSFCICTVIITGVQVKIKTVAKMYGSALTVIN